VNTSLAFSAHQKPEICLHATVGSLPVSQGQRPLAWMRDISILALVVLSLLPATLAQNIISTVAGGGPIPSAPLTADIPGPTGTIKDAAGNLYIAAPFSANIYKLSGGVLSLYSGVGWGGFGGDGGPVSAAILGKPTAFAFDSHGNLFIADFGNSRIRKVDAVTKAITTVAGKGEKCASPTSACGDGHAAKFALLNLPESVAVDSAGNIYIADSTDNRIRKVDAASQIITTIAGNGHACANPTTPCGDDGPATSAQLNFPEGVALDAAGNLYIADTKDHRIRMIAAGTSTIKAYAGKGGACLDSTQKCGDGGDAKSALLRLPQAIAVDASSSVYIADTGDHRIRLVTASTDVISTVAGSGTQGFSGDGGSATTAALDLPAYVSLDSSGNIYVSDTGNQRVRQVDSSGNIQTIAGGGLGDDAVATHATLAAPYTVFEDASGNVYFADQANNRIRMLSKTGAVSTVAGTGSAGFSGDNGPATSATLNGPSSVVLDQAGDMFIADTNNLRIRKVDALTKKIITFAGNGSSCNPTNSGCGDTGPATSANLSFPTHAALDSAGNLYIADYLSHKIRKVDTTGIITTVAGIGQPGYSGDGGPGTSAKLNHPSSVGADSAGNVYISDQYNNRIRKLDSQGTISTYALNGNTCLCGDGGPALDGSMWNPLEVSVDPSANVFVSGGNAKVVQRIDAVTGTWGTVAGIASQPGIGGFSGDGGPATSARLDSNGTVVDAQSNLYIADYGNNRIRLVHLTPDVTVPNRPLGFGNWALGTTSTPLTVTLTSSGGVDLSLSGITLSGPNAADFAETSSCGNPPPSIPLGVDSTCTVSVTFTPSDYAKRTATLTFTDNGPTSPQTVALSGSGPDFTISASPTTVTVTKGMTGTSTLTLTPLGGFSQSVNLSCSGVPANTTCKVPSPVQMDGVNPKTAVLTIQTTSSTPSGTFPITAKGAFVPLQHPVTITLIVP
jgi:sugar lactone lactonase YvrE